MRKRILVTGGAGFLGSHLCEKLLAQGHEVVCLDDLSTGHRENIQHLIANPCFRLLVHDVLAPLFMDVDEIYNLACPASPVQYQSDPIKTVKTCVLGAINALDLARQVDARILQASTSEVYGDPEVHPQQEGYWGRVNPIGIRSCYDEGKRAAECLMMDYRRQSGVDVKIARIFNTYGPRMDSADGRVVSSFVVQAIGKEDITVFGDGSQTRSFCYVDDLIEGLIRMMNTEAGFTGPVNLGNPSEYNIVELAERVIHLTGSSSRITFKPLPSDDPVRRKPDITLARQVLGWQPAIALDEGLRKTIAYFRTVLL